MNAEQAPETTNAGADPPRLWGRPKLMEAYQRTSFYQSYRGNGDGMQAKGTIHNTGSPSGDRRMDQPLLLRLCRVSTKRPAPASKGKESAS